MIIESKCHQTQRSRMTGKWTQFQGNPFVRTRESLSGGKQEEGCCEIEVGGVSVEFPYPKPYGCQIQFMATAIDALRNSENALLESPTGTGKTLCLLCSSLAWQQHTKEILAEPEQQDEAGSLFDELFGHITSGEEDTSQTPKKVPKIVYASRTHSQLTQVVEELRRTGYNPRQTILGSRQHLCIHPKVNKKEDGNAGHPQQNPQQNDIDRDCNKLCRERQCQFRNNLKEIPRNETSSEEEASKWSVETDWDSKGATDIEDLAQMGKKTKTCPFYHSRGMVAEAELIMVPYNYLLEKSARESTLGDMDWNGAIIIFDEAHNLGAFTSESSSFDLSVSEVDGCLEEVRVAIEYCSAKMRRTGQFGDKGEHQQLGSLQNLQDCVSRMKRSIEQLPHRDGGYPGEMMHSFMEHNVGVVHGNHEMLLEDIQKVNELFLEVCDLIEGPVAKFMKKGTPRLDHLGKCIKQIFGRGDSFKCEALAKNYRLVSWSLGKKKRRGVVLL